MIELFIDIEHMFLLKATYFFNIIFIQDDLIMCFIAVKDDISDQPG